MDGERPRLDLLIPALASAEQQAEERTYRPRVSSAGRCVRSLTFQALGYTPAPEVGRVSVLLADGHMHEAETVRWLAKTPYPIVDQQRGLNIGTIDYMTDEPNPCESCMEFIPGNVLHGHIDGIVVGERKHLWEHKGLNERGFEKLSYEAHNDYVQQCCCYIVGLQAAGEDINSAILLIKNKANSDYRQVFIEYDRLTDIAKVINEWNDRVFLIEDVVKKAFETFATVALSLRNKELPPRPYDYDDWQCRYCGFRAECWRGLEEQMKNRDAIEAISESDFLAQDIMAYFELKQQMTMADSRVKELRTGIMREMSARNIKSGKVGELKFTVTARKAESLDKDRIPDEVRRQATREYVMRTVSVRRERQ